MLLSPLGVSTQLPDEFAAAGWPDMVQHLRTKDGIQQELGVDWVRLLHADDPTGGFTPAQMEGTERVHRGGKQYELALYKDTEDDTLFVADHRHLSPEDEKRLMPFCDCRACRSDPPDKLTRSMPMLHGMLELANGRLWTTQFKC